MVNHAGRGGTPEMNRATRWLRSHDLAVTAESKFVPQCVFTAPRAGVKLFLQALFSGDGGAYRSGDSFFIEYYSKSRRLVEDVRHLLLRFGVFSVMREKTTSIGTPAHSSDHGSRTNRRFARAIGFCPGSVKQLRLDNEMLPALDALTTRSRSNFDTLPKKRGRRSVSPSRPREQASTASV